MSFPNSYGAKYIDFEDIEKYINTSDIVNLNFKELSIENIDKYIDMVENKYRTSGEKRNRLNNIVMRYCFYQKYKGKECEYLFSKLENCPMTLFYFLMYMNNQYIGKILKGQALYNLLNYTKKNIKNHIKIIEITKKYLEPMDFNLIVEVATKFNNPRLICLLFNEYNNYLNMNHLNKLNASIMVLKMQGISLIDKPPYMYYAKDGMFG